MKKETPKYDREKMLHPTRAPRLEGMFKNKMMNPVRKKKGQFKKRSR